MPPASQKRLAFIMNVSFIIGKSPKGDILGFVCDTLTREGANLELSLLAELNHDVEQATPPVCANGFLKLR